MNWQARYLGEWFRLVPPRDHRPLQMGYSGADGLYRRSVVRSAGHHMNCRVEDLQVGPIGTEDACSVAACNEHD